MSKAQRFLIVGAAGLVGGTIAKELASTGVQVIGIDLADRIVLKNYHPIENVTYRGADIFKPGTMMELLHEFHPDVLINTVNVATLLSHDPQHGYPRLIKFYVEMYNAITHLRAPLHYVQIGTTGSGGLGFNLPFTHGDKMDELPIIHKAAFAGVTTSLLTMLSRSFDGEVQVSEVKPGLAIFSDHVTAREYAGARLLAADGGESGFYTYNELALLTATMGFTTADAIAKKVIAVLHGKRSVRRVNSFDVIEAINTTIIAPVNADERRKAHLIKILKQEQGETYIIATGNLGPPSITRDLILGYALIKKTPVAIDAGFWESIQADASIRATLAYIQEYKPELLVYLSEECTYQRYQHLAQRVRKAKEPWQLLAS